MPRPTATPCLVDAQRAAAPASARGGGATRAALIHRLQDRVDELAQLESLEARSTSAHDRKIAMAEAIATMAEDLRASYRGGTATRPPLWLSADGAQAGW